MFPITEQQHMLEKKKKKAKNMSTDSDHFLSFFFGVIVTEAEHDAFSFFFYPKETFNNDNGLVYKVLVE